MIVDAVLNSHLSMIVDSVLSRFKHDSGLSAEQT